MLLGVKLKTLSNGIAKSERNCKKPWIENITELQHIKLESPYLYMVYYFNFKYNQIKLLTEINIESYT